MTSSTEHQGSNAEAVPRYYFVVEGKRIGPVGRDDLLQMALDNRIDAQTLCWCQGMSDWQAAGTVPAITAILQQAPPAIPSTPVADTASSPLPEINERAPKSVRSRHRRGRGDASRLPKRNPRPRYWPLIRLDRWILLLCAICYLPAAWAARTIPSELDLMAAVTTMIVLGGILGVGGLLGALAVIVFRNKVAWRLPFVVMAVPSFILTVKVIEHEFLSAHARSQQVGETLPATGGQTWQPTVPTTSSPSESPNTHNAGGDDPRVVGGSTPDMQRVGLAASGPYIAQSAGAWPDLTGNQPLSARYATEEDRSQRAASMELPGGTALVWVQFTLGTDPQRHIASTRFVSAGMKTANPAYVPPGISFYEPQSYRYIPPGSGEYVTEYTSEAIQASAPGGDGGIIAASFYMRYMTVDPDWTQFRSATRFDPRARLESLVRLGVTPLTLRSFGGTLWIDNTTLYGNQNHWDAVAEAHAQSLERRGHTFARAEWSHCDVLRRLGYGSERALLHVDVNTPDVIEQWMFRGQPIAAQDKPPLQLQGLLEVDLRECIPSRGFLAGDIFVRAAPGDEASLIAIVGQYSPLPAQSVVHIQYFKNGQPSGPIETRSVRLDPRVYFFEYATNICPADADHTVFRDLIEGPGITFDEGGEAYNLDLVPMVVSVP